MMPSGLTESLKGADVSGQHILDSIDPWTNTQRAPWKIRAAIQSRLARWREADRTHQHYQPLSRSPAPYFGGKAANEKAVIESGMSYANLKDNRFIMAWRIFSSTTSAYLMKRFPRSFGLPGDGSYRLPPIYVDDLADLVCRGCLRPKKIM